MAGTLQAALLLSPLSSSSSTARRPSPIPPSTRRLWILPPKPREKPSISTPITASVQADGDVDGDVDGRGPAKLGKWLISFASDNFVPLGLTLLSGEEISAAVEAWPVGLFGLGSILLFTPYFSKIIIQIQVHPREFMTGVADYVDKNRKLFSKIIAICLGLVPWIQVSRLRSLLLMVKPTIFLVAIGMGIGLHLILLAFNTLALRCLSTISGSDQSVFAKKENATAALLVASQKTLTVMFAVVEPLRGALSESGSLVLLPCVAAHLLQIVMDSILVNIWIKEDTSSKSTKMA